MLGLCMLNHFDQDHLVGNVAVPSSAVHPLPKWTDDDIYSVARRLLGSVCLHDYRSREDPSTDDYERASEAGPGGVDVGSVWRQHVHGAYSLPEHCDVCVFE